MSSQYIGINEARPKLGDLVTAVQQGADIVLTRNGRPAARIVRYQEEPMTTSSQDARIGTWAFLIDNGSASPEDAVASAVRSIPGNYDIKGLTEAYRRKINQALPGGVRLVGDEFWGPEEIESPSRYPLDYDGNVDIQAIVREVPLTGLLDCFDMDSSLAERQEARDTYLH